MLLERGDDAGLGERGFSDAGIADQDRQPAGRRERIEHIDGFARASKKIIAVLFFHRGQTAIRAGVAPQLPWSAAVACGGVEQAGDRAFSADGSGVTIQCICRKNGRPGRVLAFEQDDNQREFRGRPDMPVVRLVVFRDLPFSEPRLADQQ